MSSKMEDMLMLTHVPRWGTVPAPKEQSVAEHSFGVAVIAMELATFRPHPEAWLGRVAMWALHHDAAESYTGDLPSPFKKRFEDVGKYEMEVCPWMVEAKLSTDEEIRVVVKLADTIEALAWINKWAPNAKWRHPDQPNRYIEEVLRERIHTEARAWEHHFPGIRAKVEDILGKVAT